MILEGADRALCGVTAVDMGRAKLEGDVLLVEEVDEGSGRLVVQLLQFGLSPRETRILWALR